MASLRAATMEVAVERNRLRIELTRAKKELEAAHVAFAEASHNDCRGGAQMQEQGWMSQEKADQLRALLSLAHEIIKKPND